MVRKVLIHEGILALEEVLLERLLKQDARLCEEILELRTRIARMRNTIDAARDQGLDSFDDKVYKETVLF